MRDLDLEPGPVVAYVELSEEVEAQCSITSASCLDQLIQFLDGPIRDGKLISKNHRDHLVKVGYANRTSGFNLLTQTGVNVLVNLGILKP